MKMEKYSKGRTPVKLYTADLDQTNQCLRVIMSLKGYRLREFKPGCKHLQTEVSFFYLCTWNEHWEGKNILNLSKQHLSLFPKAEIIISLVVTQFLREVIHLIFLYNLSIYLLLSELKVYIACCLAPFKLLTVLEVASFKATHLPQRKLKLLIVSFKEPTS